MADARPPSPLMFQAPSEGWPQPGPGAESWSWGAWRRVTPRAPAGLRVLVVGGSTTYGERVGPFQAFGGWLERGLAAATGQPVEVINLGVGGYASRHAVHVLEQALAAGPVDLAIVYSGNNEFLEVLALKVARAGFSSEQELLRRRLWRLHGYRLLARWLVPTPPVPERLPQPVTALESQADPADRRLVHRLYAESLEQAISAARRHGAPLLLATVADNLEHRPAAPLDPADDAWAAEQAGRSPEALDPLLADPAAAHAARWHALGRRLLAAGQRERALVALHHAERLDPSPHRSDDVMRSSLLALGGRTPVCDVAGALEAAGAIGDADFLDRCHPDPGGHRRIADALLACIGQEGLLHGVTADARTVDPPDPDALDAWAVPLGLPAPPAEGWQAALAEGHEAFLSRRTQRSWNAYARAEALGAPAAAVARSRALLLQHDPDRFDRQRLAELAAAAGDPGLAAGWTGAR